MELMKRKIKTRCARLIFSVIIITMVLYTVGLAQVAEPRWPRDINVPDAKILMYQPQLETFKDNKLTARAAVSVTPTGQTEPVFGAVWIEATLSTDRDTRTVNLVSVDVPMAKFPDAPQDKVDKLKAILEREIPKWDLNISLDRLITMLDLVDKEKKVTGDIKTTPPEIIVVTHPAVLVVIQGQPQLSKLADSKLMRIVNTPFFIVFDPDKKNYYLKGGNDWLSATEIKGPWKAEPSPPASAVTEAAKAQDDDKQSTEQGAFDQMPQIIVVTEPTELIVMDGPATYSTIYGTNLLYVSNTQNDVFMEIDSQHYYVLLSGRWFTAKSFDSKWKYVSSDQLPADFAKIPPGSTKDHVLANVTGTNQANEAVLETYVPQTSTVKRSEASLTVVYDGEPKFVAVEDADLFYAVNTSYSVIRYGSRYYCCDNAVWFEASSPMGPWEICVAVPQAIYTIPPSNPIYNVRYVYVYDYTPEVVYVGYTPGYVGSYVYGGTVIYGTGYIYRPWYGSVYYPRPATWGFAVRYNPHTGNWGFAVGYRGPGGWFIGGRYGGGGGWHGGGWWGVGGYRNVDIDINRNININRTQNNIYNRRRDTTSRTPARRPGATRPGSRPGTSRPAISRPDTKPTSRPAHKNNVFADRDGNVHRRTDKGWQSRDRGAWSDRKPATSRPSTSRTPSSRPSTSNLDRQYQARERGTTRTNNYSNLRSSGTRSRQPSRGGGRRR